MTTYTPGEQKTSPRKPDSSPKQPYHVVCHDCTHEVLVDSRDDAHRSAREHADEKPNHTVRYAGIQQAVPQ